MVLGDGNEGNGATGGAVTNEQLLSHIIALIQKQDERLANLEVSRLGTSKSGDKIAEIASQLQQFTYDENSDVDFACWYARYEPLLKIDGKDLDDKTKSSIIVRKLGPKEHNIFSNIIKPKSPESLSLEETVSQLKHFSAERLHCLKIDAICWKLRKSPLKLCLRMLQELLACQSNSSTMI